jgi:hypothetical protein
MTEARSPKSGSARSLKPRSELSDVRHRWKTERSPITRPVAECRLSRRLLRPRAAPAAVADTGWCPRTAWQREAAFDQRRTTAESAHCRAPVRAAAAGADSRIPQSSVSAEAASSHWLHRVSPTGRRPIERTPASLWRFGRGFNARRRLSADGVAVGTGFEPASPDPSLVPCRRCPVRSRSRDTGGRTGFRSRPRRRTCNINWCLFR